jgi:hypothetical protein
MFSEEPLLVAAKGSRTLGWRRCLREYFVYIMSNVSRTLYIGMTNNLERRVW